MTVTKITEGKIRRQTIPPHAQCVFKGEVFDVYQWPQEMFDGTTETFEMARRMPAALVIALQGNDVLYAKQEQPVKGAFLSLLGGRMEEGEEPLEAAKRELREEAGLESEKWFLLREYHARGKIDWTVYIFVAGDCRKVCEPDLDAGERIEVMRAPLDIFIRDILPRPDFLAAEIKSELFSAFNPAAADKIVQDIGAGYIGAGEKREKP